MPWYLRDITVMIKLSLYGAQADSHIPVIAIFLHDVILENEP